MQLRLAPFLPPQLSVAFRIILILLLPFSMNRVAAQVTTPAEALALPSDTARLRAFTNLASNEVKSNRPDSAIRLLEMAQAFNNTSTPSSLASYYYWQKGEAAYKKKDYAVFNKMADTVLQLNPPGEGAGEWRAKGLVQKGFAAIHLGDLTKATNLIKEAIALYQKLGDRLGEAKGYQAIGNISMQGRQVAEAQNQYRRAIPILMEEGKDADVAMISCSLSRTFIVDNHIDSAFAWNDKAKPIAAKYPDNLELNYMVWQNEGDYHARAGRLEEADRAFQKAMVFAQRMNTGYTLGGLLQVMSFAAFNNGKLEKAVDYAERARTVLEELGDYPMLQKTYQLLYTIYEGKGDYKKAYESLDSYITIADSLFTKESMQQINDLNVKYETSEKEKQIAEQELDITRKNARLRNLFFGLAAAGLMITLLVVLYVQRKKSYQQSLVTLKKEQDISLLKALMTGEEKERNRLARELHDGLGGILAAAQMQISRLPAEPAGAAADDKQKAAELVSQAASETRRIAHNLLPETLLRFGLDEALREYTQSITDSGLLKIDYLSSGLDQPLEQSVELSIYRIIQELLNNIIKHAGATEALVQVQRPGNLLSITVEDNGKGFAPREETKAGIGLSNIESRISYLNGSIDIRSEQQRGTSVYIEIQLQKNG